MKTWLLTAAACGTVALSPSGYAQPVQPEAEAAATAEPVHLVGKWWGEAGLPQDRIELGMEIVQREDGALHVLFYQPVMNFFGLELPGGVRQEGDAYIFDALGGSFALDDDVLEGEITSLKLPMRLARVESLPREEPIPEFPTGPGPSWVTKLGAPVCAPVSERDGVVYVGTTGGVFQAVNARDGSFNWVFNAGGPVYGGALVTDDAVYFVCDNGFLFRLDRATGREVWRYDLGDAQVERLLGHQYVFEYDCVAPRPLMVEDVVYVGSGDGTFHAVNASSGSRLWTYATQGKIRGGASSDGNLIFFGSLDRHLYALDRTTGAEVWKKDTRGQITSAPALIDGRLIIGTRGSALLAFNPADGEVLWKTLYWGSWVESEPVLVDGKMYIGSSDMRRATCYDPVDGSVVWRTDVYGWSWGRPLVTDSHVYVGAAGVEPYLIRHAGGLVALDRSNGKVTWRWPVPAAAGTLHSGFVGGPVLAGGVIVIAGLDGGLYGFHTP